MLHLQQLLSFHIIELYKNNKMYMTWTYPTISNQTKTLVLSKIALNIGKQHFTYFRINSQWIYITNTDVFESDRLDSIKSFSFVIISKDLNPEKYTTFGRILSKCYCKTGSPVELVKLYLSVFTTGCCSTQENGTFSLRDFDSNNNCTKVKELINLFSLEIILLYTAILLKKRVVLYHHSQDILLKWLPSVSSLLPHRNPNTYLFPIMDLTKDDLTVLKNNNYFVAGFKDSNICSKTDLFDLLVNFPATEITVAPQAKEDLTMTKTHKDIAMFMVQLAENKNLSDNEIIKEIENKTTELLSYLKGLASNLAFEKITEEDIQSKNLHSALENFLFNLAIAENWLVY